MPKVIFNMGEAEIGAQNTQIGVLPVEINNSYLKQQTTLNFRNSTILEYVYGINDFTNVTFFISELRKWAIIIIETAATAILEIIDLATEAKLATIDIYDLKNPLIKRHLITEVSSTEGGRFLHNTATGVSRIFICGLTQLYYLDDDLTLKAFSFYIESSATSITNPADVTIGQRRFTILAQDIAYTYDLMLSKVDVFDEAGGTESVNGFPLKFYLDPQEVLYSVVWILDAIYITSSSGLRQVYASDRTQDIIAATNAMQELIGYSEALPTRAQYYSGSIIYATRSGLRYKSPQATYSQDWEDIGEASLPLARSLDSEIKAIGQIKRTHTLLILLENGIVKAISEGSNIGQGMKTFPIYTYINNDNFKVVDIFTGERTYYLVHDYNEYLYILREEPSLIPLCDGVKPMDLTALVTSSTANSITFDANSLIATQKPQDVWIYLTTLYGWVNFFRQTSDLNVYVSNVSTITVPSLTGLTVKYLPTTNDIRPYLPIGFNEYQMLTTSSYIYQETGVGGGGSGGGVPIDDWFTRGLKVVYKNGGGSLQIAIKAMQGPFPEGTQTTFVFSTFVEASDIIDKEGISITSSMSYSKEIQKYSDYVRDVSFNWGLGNLAGYFKVGAREKGVRGGSWTQSRQSNVKSRENVNVYTANSNSAYKKPNGKRFVWVYAVYPFNMDSNTISLDPTKSVVYFNGVRQELNNATELTTGAGSKETYEVKLLNVSAPADDTGTLYLSSTCMTTGAITGLTNPYDIVAAKQFFCAENSTDDYFLPRKITADMTLIKLQDDAIGLKNLASSLAGTFNVTGNLEAHTVNMKYVLDKREDPSVRGVYDV